MSIKLFVVFTLLVAFDFYLLNEIFVLHERIDYLAELLQLQYDSLLHKIKNGDDNNDFCGKAERRTDG